MRAGSCMGLGSSLKVEAVVDHFYEMERRKSRSARVRSVIQFVALFSAFFAAGHVVFGIAQRLGNSLSRNPSELASTARVTCALEKGCRASSQAGWDI